MQTVIGTNQKGKFVPIVASSKQVELDETNLMNCLNDESMKGPTELLTTVIGNLCLTADRDALMKHIKAQEDVTQNDVLMQIREKLNSSSACINTITKYKKDKETVLFIVYNE